MKRLNLNVNATPKATISYFHLIIKIGKAIKLIELSKVLDFIRRKS